MDRFFKMRKGTIAVSPCLHSQSTKEMTSTPKVTKRPMIRGLFQGYTWPPHCRVSSNETTAPMKRTVPTASICLSFVCSGRSWFTWLAEACMRTNAMTAMITATPTGTLLFNLSTTGERAYGSKAAKDRTHTHPEAPPCKRIIVHG